jgi:hypothetical protein
MPIHFCPLFLKKHESSATAKVGLWDSGYKGISTIRNQGFPLILPGRDFV